MDTLRKLVEPVWMVALYLLALAGLFFVSAAFRALALIFVGYETLAAWVFAGTTRYRVPWDFVLALLAAAALERLPFEAAVAAAVEPVAVDLLGPLGAAVLREALDRAAPRLDAHRGGAGRVGGEREHRLGERLGFARRHEQAGLAVADEVLEAADRGGDHRPRPLHRLERDHPEAFAERRHDDRERLLDRLPGSASRGRGSAPHRSGPARA